VLYGNARAINIAEIEPQENVPAGNATELSIQKIFKKIKMGTDKELEPAVAECVDTFAENHISIQEYRIYIMELVADLFRFSSNNHLNPDEIFGADSDVYSEVIQLDSTEALKEWLLLVSTKMREMVLSERQDNTSTFVARALEYVREHFADSELTVETVCSQLGISTSYFSTMFKKVTGKTFVNYLTEYRMEAAVELLLTGNAKTYVIAEQTGYSDPNYFSYVFKKQFGMSPSKYRAEKLGERE
jgi:two-component system response regulator YesN